MADRYYVNSSNTKETQTVYIRRNEERIILLNFNLNLTKVSVLSST